MESLLTGSWLMHSPPLEKGSTARGLGIISARICAFWPSASLFDSVGPPHDVASCLCDDLVFNRDRFRLASGGRGEKRSV